MTSVHGRAAVACPFRGPSLPSAYRLSAWGFSAGPHVVTVRILGTVTHSHSSGASPGLCKQHQVSLPQLPVSTLSPVFSGYLALLFLVLGDQYGPWSQVAE